MAAPRPGIVPLPPGAQPAAAPDKPASKPVLRMCPVCFNSLPETNMVEFEGKKVCPTCQPLLVRQSRKPSA